MISTDDKNAIQIKLDAVTELLNELAGEKRITFTGEVGRSDVIVQRSGCTYFFEFTDERGHFIIFYPENTAAEIGELLSSGTFFSLLVTLKPQESFGVVTLWIYSAADIISVDGRRLTND